MTECRDCTELADGQHYTLLKAQRDIRKYRPEKRFRIGPRDGRPILYIELPPWTQESGRYEQAGPFVCAGTPEPSHAMYLEQIGAG